MRSDKEPGGRTFLEEARRAQIVACAIDVLAEDGYAQATLARIAARAGVSKSVVVYHFGGKDEVFAQVVTDVFTTATAIVGPRVQAAPTPAAMLAEYLRARVGFLGTHGKHMLALFEIWLNLRTADGRPRYGEPDAQGAVDVVQRILRAGQEAGEFTDFDAPVVAMAVRQAVDGALLQWRNDPGLDLQAYADELVRLFDRATRRSS